MCHSHDRMMRHTIVGGHQPHSVTIKKLETTRFWQNCTMVMSHTSDTARFHQNQVRPTYFSLLAVQSFALHDQAMTFNKH